MKDVVVFVNAIRPATFDALERHAAQTGEVFTPVVLVDEKIQVSIEERNGQLGHLQSVPRISANFDSPSSVQQALAPFMDRIFAVTSQYENSIHELRKLVPYLPYLHMPSESSLKWATEKSHMRELIGAYNSDLVPAYLEVQDASARTIRAIEQSMSYPVVVKPSGLEGSLLVSLANNAGELKAAITHTLDGAQQAYNKWIKRQAPVILVEEFMDGDMYSIDTYVSATGECRHTPLVHVVTGRKVGFDDFFGYMRSTPTDLPQAEIEAANFAAEQACHALGLRSVTAHVELMRTTQGWKIIELGPRIGGFRHEIYSHGFELNHIVNDILNRGGREPIIPEEPIAHVAFLNVYAREEGILRSVDGLHKVKKLPSHRASKQDYEIGELVTFAKNNGDPIVEALLVHADKSQLEQDIAATEELLRFGVEAPQYTR
jgi:biotin carboxylase